MIAKSKIFHKLRKQLFFPLKSKPKVIILNNASNVKIEITIVSRIKYAYAFLLLGSYNGLSIIIDMVDTIMKKRMMYS